MDNVIDLPVPREPHTLDELISFLEECREKWGGTLPFILTYDPHGLGDTSEIAQVNLAALEDNEKKRFLLGVLE